VGEARSDLSPSGIIKVGGEQWTAELAPGEQPIPNGTRVEVVGHVGIRLLVKKAKS
jgi:membrane-bound ClpP family serine protease